MNDLLCELGIFFSPARIINISFWLFSVYTFHKTAIRRKESIWQGLIGPDNKMQVHEIAAFYWVLLFPELVFAQMLIIVTNLEVEKSHLELFTYIELSLTAIAGAVIFKRDQKAKNES